MTEKSFPIIELLQQDQRYKLEGYQFVREALQYAQEVLSMPAQETASEKPEKADPKAPKTEHHLTGQQLCEAIRVYAVEQYGYLAQTVLNNWGIHTTGDFGEIVYNLIRIEEMRKSKHDRREDFDDQYNFDDAFQPIFHLNTARE
ncbi:MAG: hypothetical protein NTW52_19700 [Planctomycetota bacterium]|nr:hypothetical protein [Planctomycetota bacterium]